MQNMLKLKNYILIAVAVYLISVIVALPASWVLNPIDKQLGERLRLESTTGTLWRGKTYAVIENQTVQLDWNWKLLKLFLLNIEAELRLKSELLDAKTVLRAGPGSISVNSLSGLINAPALNRALKNGGVRAQIENDIYLQNLNLLREKSEFVEASGLASWEGGLVRAKDLLGGEAEFPPLTAELQRGDDGLLVHLKEKGKAATLVDIDLSNDGSAHVKVKERIGKFVKIPDQLKRGDPEGVMFEIKRQVFETGGAV
jgi:hypothetical protein